MLTLLVVFKDLVPAYRIRPAGGEAEEGGDKVGGGRSSGSGDGAAGAAAGDCMDTAGGASPAWRLCVEGGGR